MLAISVNGMILSVYFKYNILPKAVGLTVTI